MNYEFKAQSKRLMELMIHSIYTNKEIFLRELISNASDATDKMYYESLTNPDLTFSKEDYVIELIPNKEERTLTIQDHGIGMNKEDLMENLGTIAQSGSLEFKKKLQEDQEDSSELIGQFGVGFYSAFLVADKVDVYTRRFDENQGYHWQSQGVEGFSIEEKDKEESGTTICLHLKANEEDENYDQFLDQYKLKEMVERYSNYIRYPIQMEMTKSRLVEKENQDPDAAPEYENYQEVDTLNSMVPIWKKAKKDLSEEDYINFYHEEGFGFDEPLAHIHMNVEGVVNYRGILYIPSMEPFNWRSKDFKKGLKLYSNGVLIMDKCEQLLPDAFSFVTGVIDSEDLNLNISREILQEDRELRIISKNIEKKIKEKLLDLLKNKREDYITFYKAFGTTFKTAIYESFGGEKEKYGDLLVFVSSKEKEYVTLDEYLERMEEDQDRIYYATGDSLASIDQLPQKEGMDKKNLEVLYLLDPLDEFVLKVMQDYKGKAFSSINTEKKEDLEHTEEEKGLFKEMKEILDGEVVEVKTSEDLGDHPLCLLSRGEISIEMEKVLQLQGQDLEAEKVLEINKNHPIYQKLLSLKDDKENLKKYTKLLYNQGRLIEGLTVKNPTEYTKTLFDLLADKDNKTK